MPEMLNKILTNAKNIPGWTTKRKIVVFESDDWGTIRMPNKEVLSLVSKRRPDMLRNDFYRYDTLAPRKDLDDLFAVLQSVKDSKGRSACMTPFCNMVNPDFAKIRESDFQTFVWEDFTKTLASYYPDQKVFEKWQQGMGIGVWSPEYHGREHINVPKWMKLLRSKDAEALYFFDLEMAHFPFATPLNTHFQSVAPTYYYDSVDEIPLLQNSLQEGLEVFKNIFGREAKSFCPPNAIFSRELEKGLQNSNLKAIVVERNRIEPTTENKIHVENYLFKYGVRNGLGQVYYRRNAKFEPIQKDFSVEKTLFEVNAALRWGKPAVISTHRVNFVSALNDDKKSKSLKDLKGLLSKIVAQWGDVEFLSSGDLVDLMIKR